MSDIHIKHLHQTIQLQQAGEQTQPEVVIIMMHGRGGSAINSIRFVESLTLPSKTLILAPEAEHNTWYPESFLEPRQANQPYVNGALGTIDLLLEFLKNAHGILPTQVVLAGFSQGACVAAEYICQHPVTLAGVAILSGGLVGTDEEVGEVVTLGDLTGVPVYLGCDTNDHYIPYVRVEQTAAILKAANAEIILVPYTELGHAIHPEGCKFIESCAAAVVSSKK